MGRPAQYPGSPGAGRIRGRQALFGGQVGHGLGLGRAVGDQDLGLRERQTPGAELGVGDRRASGQQPAQGRPLDRPALDLGGEAVEERRRGGAGGHVVLPHLGEDAGGVHPVDAAEVHRRHDGRHAGRQVVEREDGEHRHLDVPLLGRELGGEGGALGEQEPVGAVRPLGLAGGAGGEGDQGGVVGRDRMDRRRFRALLQFGQRAPRRPGTEMPAGGDGDRNPPQPRIGEPEQVALANPQPGPGIGEGREGGDLPPADPGIDEDGDGAHLEQGQHGDVEVDRHRDHHDRPLAGLEPQAPQPRRGAADAVPEVTEGDRAGLHDQRRTVRDAESDLAQDVEDVVGRGRGHTALQGVASRVRYSSQADC